jgi:hypothetical protein
MAVLTTGRTHIHRMPNGVTTTATRAQGAIKGMAPLLDECLTQGQAAAEAVLARARQATPHIAAVHQRPWVLVGSALLMGYFLGSVHSPSPATHPVPSRPPGTQGGRGGRRV